MTKKKNLTTAAHFEEFKRVGEYWIERLSLSDWVIIWEHEPADIESSYAECAINRAGHRAWIRLNSDWGETEVTAEEITRSARHEVAELLLLPMQHLARERFITEDEVCETKHQAIARLENLMTEIGEDND